MPKRKKPTASAQRQTSTSGSSYPVKKRRKKSRISRKLKRQIEFFTSLGVFAAVVITTVAIGYDFVEGYYQEQSKKQALKANQVIPIYDVQLSLTEEDVNFKFFMEQDEEGNLSELVTTKFPMERLSLKKRSNLPYPYLKANCPKDNKYCTVAEAETFTLYLKDEDVQKVQLPH